MKDYAKAFYLSEAWRNTRDAYIKSVGGLCELCLKEGMITPAEIVHHKVFLTPDNIMATAAAAFLVVIGIAFFIFRRTQTASSRLTTAEITRLGKLYEEEVNSNKDLREYIRNQNEVISNLNETVTKLSKKSDLTKTDMEHVNKLALATATMVKDVFMNSKTIDSSGKNLLLHDYTKALEESEKFGEVANEDK